jgi:hypothetical protein
MTTFAKTKEDGAFVGSPSLDQTDPKGVTIIVNRTHIIGIGIVKFIYTNGRCCNQTREGEDVWTFIRIKREN